MRRKKYGIIYHLFIMYILACSDIPVNNDFDGQGQRNSQRISDFDLQFECVFVLRVKAFCVFKRIAVLVAGDRRDADRE